METPSAITEARSNAARLGSVASEYASAAYTIPDQLKKTVQEALDYNKDIVGLRSTALADYQAAPAQARSKFGVETFSAGPQAGQRNQDFIFNPFERNAAITSFITNQGIPFSTANTLLGMREGTVADTVDAGTRAFNAQAAASQAAATAARQTYADVLSEFKTMTELDQTQQKINQSGADSGLDPALAAWLQKLLQGEETPQGPMGPENNPALAGIEEDGMSFNLNNIKVPNLPNMTAPVSASSAMLAPAAPKQQAPAANIKSGKLSSNPAIKGLKLTL